MKRVNEKCDDYNTINRLILRGGGSELQLCEGGYSRVDCAAVIEEVQSRRNEYWGIL